MSTLFAYGTISTASFRSVSTDVRIAARSSAMSYGAFEEICSASGSPIASASHSVMRSRLRARAMVAAAGPVRQVVEDELTLLELVTVPPPEPPSIEAAPVIEQTPKPTPPPAPAAPRPRIKQPTLAQPEAPLRDEPPWRRFCLRRPARSDASTAQPAA